MKKINVLLLAAFAPLVASASRVSSEENSVGGRPASTVKVDFSTSGNTSLESRNQRSGGAAVSRLGVEFTQPLPPLGDDYLPSIGISYTGFYIDRDTGTALPERLQSVGLPLSVFKTFNPTWSALAVIAPSVSNAGSSFSSDGFGVNAFGLATYTFSPEFNVSFGVAADTLSTGFGALLPVVGTEWRFDPEWTLNLGFPRTDVTWQATNSLSLAARVEVDFGTFYVKDDPLPGAPGKPSLRDTTLDYTAIRLGVGADYALSKDFTVGVSTGVLVSRTADYNDRNYKLESRDATAFAGLTATYMY